MSIDRSLRAAYAQRIALQFAARRDEAKVAMKGFDVEGKKAPTPSLIAHSSAPFRYLAGRPARCRPPENVTRSFRRKSKTPGSTFHCPDAPLDGLRSAGRPRRDGARECCVSRRSGRKPCPGCCPKNMPDSRPRRPVTSPRCSRSAILTDPTRWRECTPSKAARVDVRRT